MSVWLIVFLIFLFIVAIAGTLYAFKQEEKKIKYYEEMGDTASDELQRSHDYEEESLKSNIPLQIAIYGVTIVLTVIAVIWFLV